MSGGQVVDSGKSEFGIYSLVRLSLLSLHVFLRKIGILLPTLKIIMHIINHMTPSSPDLSPDFQIHTSSCLFELLIFPISVDSNASCSAKNLGQNSCPRLISFSSSLLGPAGNLLTPSSKYKPQSIQ